MIAFAKMLAVVGTVALTPGLAKAGDEDFYYEAKVRIEVSELVPPSDAAHIEKQRKSLLKTMRTRLTEHHLVLDGDETEAAKVVVTLRWIDFDVALLAIDVAVTRPDGSTASLETVECTCVHITNMTAALEGRLNPLLSMLERPATVDVAVGPKEPKGERPVSVAPKPKVRAWGPVAVIGGGVALGGLASIGAGIWSFGRDSNDGPRLDVRFDRTYTYDRRGAALVGVGGVAIVSGLGLFVLDLTVLKKRRASRKTTVLPIANPAGAGVVWTGRF